MGDAREHDVREQVAGHEVGHVVVCGVDGSPGGQRALGWAIEEAGRRGAVVRAVSAWSWDGVDELDAPSTPDEAVARARSVLDATVEAVLHGVTAAATVERVTQRGSPSDALCIAALDAELLVLGSHGHGGVHDKLLGSTTERTLHHAPCPVVVVPDPRRVEKNVRRARAQQERLEGPRPNQVV